MYFKRWVPADGKERNIRFVFPYFYNYCLSIYQTESTQTRLLDFGSVSLVALGAFSRAGISGTTAKSRKRKEFLAIRRAISLKEKFVLFC